MNPKCCIEVILTVNKEFCYVLLTKLDFEFQKNLKMAKFGQNECYLKISPT